LSTPGRITYARSDFSGWAKKRRGVPLNHSIGRSERANLVGRKGLRRLVKEFVKRETKTIGRPEGTQKKRTRSNAGVRIKRGKKKKFPKGKYPKDGVD